MRRPAENPYSSPAIRGAALVALTLLALAAAACTPASSGSADSGGSKPSTEQSATPHKSGAYDYSQFPKLEDPALLPQAADTFGKLQSVRVIQHTTAKQDATLTVAVDSAIDFVTPDSAKFDTQQSMSGAKSGLIRIGNSVWISTDGTSWGSKETTTAGPFEFSPSEVAQLLRSAKTAYVVAKGQPAEWSKSATVVAFERPSPVYPGQTQQLVVSIDDTTKLPVRLEVIDAEGKPTDFTETFYRYADYDSPEIKVAPPAK
jgi:hypothetical protein